MRNKANSAGDIYLELTAVDDVFAVSCKEP